MRRIYTIALCLTALAAYVKPCFALQKGDTIASIKSKPKPVTKSTPKSNTRGRRSVKTSGPGKASQVAQKPPAPAIPAAMVVSRLGQGQFRTIGGAIRACKPGAHIVVRTGIYSESLVIDKPVEISPAEASGEVIVEGSTAPCLTARVEQAVVRGITFSARGGVEAKTAYAVEVTGGRLVMENCTVVAGTKGAIHIRGMDANPMLRFCRIDAGSGTGVLADDSAHGTLDGCTITGTAEFGIVIGQASTTTVRNCHVRLTKGTGIDIRDGSKPLIEGTEVSGTSGSGIWVRLGSSPTIRNCTAHDAGWDGILFEQGTSGLVEDCEMFRCRGGFSSNNSSPTVRRCKIHDVRDRGIWALFSSTATFEDCEVVGAPNIGIYISNGSDPYFRHCTVRDCPKWGVLVQTDAKGTLENCDVLGNGFAGVTIDHSNTVLRNCRVNRNSVRGVWLGNNAVATVTDCDLTGNKEGPFRDEPGCRIHEAGNKK